MAPSEPCCTHSPAEAAGRFWLCRRLGVLYGDIAFWGQFIHYGFQKDGFNFIKSFYTLALELPALEIPAMALPPSNPASIPHGKERKFATFRAISALVLREMATRYGRSPGGYAWAIIEPAGAIIVLGIAMSILVRVPPLGSSFVLFFATAYLPLTLYQGIASNVGRCINFSRALLLYPAVTWVDAAIARFILTALTEVVVMMIIYTTIITITNDRSGLDLVIIVQAVSLACFLGVAIGTLNCVLFGLFDVWMQVWGILTRPMFLVSGVFFLYDDMPASVQSILWWNPVLHITGLMRRGFYSTYDAPYVSITYVMGVSAICLFLGVILLGRYHRDILNR
jgi:capsular polysaccharide transport system permease protein